MPPCTAPSLYSQLQTSGFDCRCGAGRSSKSQTLEGGDNKASGEEISRDQTRRGSHPTPASQRPLCSPASCSGRGRAISPARGTRSPAPQPSAVGQTPACPGNKRSFNSSPRADPSCTPRPDNVSGRAIKPLLGREAMEEALAFLLLAPGSPRGCPHRRCTPDPIPIPLSVLQPPRRPA